MKYIMFKAEKPCPRLIPFIFPDFMVHSQVAKVMKHLLARDHDTNVTVHSAGEVQMISVKTHGKSETLNVEADRDDAQIIANYSYFHGLLE